MAILINSNIKQFTREHDEMMTRQIEYGKIWLNEIKAKYNDTKSNTGGAK